MGAIEDSDTTGDGAADVSWSTGDPEKDWARYEGQFDRIDRGLQHRSACLLAFDGLLVIGIALAGYGNATALWPMLAVLSFWGFAVSLAVFWAQYRAVAHRRVGALRWSARYPEVYPAPGGAEYSRSGRISTESPALIPLISVIMWLLIGTYIVMESWILVPTRDSAKGAGALAGIAVVVVLFKFLDSWGAFNDSINPEKASPRKW